MNFEKFSDGTSFLHRADPRGKLISTGILTLIIALSQSWLTALLGLLLACVLIFTAGLSWSKLFRRLLIVNSFNLLLCLVLPLTYTGDSTFSLLGINLNRTGLLLGLLITIKSNAVILLFVSLLATSTAVQLGHALQQLRVSPKLCLLLLFSYRYVSLIQQEIHRLQRAATLRCFHPKTNLHTYRTYSYMLGMMLVRSWNRGNRVQQAMELRGFSDRFHTLNDTGAIRKSDLLLSAGLLSVGMGLVLMDILF